MDCIAADPSGIFRCQEGNDATDIVRLSQTLERLHAQRKVAAGVRFLRACSSPGFLTIGHTRRVPSLPWLSQRNSLS